MMKQEKLGKLLNELADATAEPVSPTLAEDIKQHIPHRLVPHKIGMDTINIIIDLRINKLTAAAVIIIAMFLSANFLGGRSSTSDIYQGGKLLIKYCVGRETTDKSQLLAGMPKLYENLVRQGKDAVYYGNTIDLKDSNAVLMQWKLSDGKYRVILSDLREKTVSAEELIKLQTQMLQKKAK